MVTHGEEPPLPSPEPALAARRWPLALSPELVALLAQRYQAPPRAYHHLGHVVEVMAWVDWVEARVPWLQPVEVCAAVLFHDVVYEPGAKDNEARSAAMARAAIAAHRELGQVSAERVAFLIEATARHGKLVPGDVDDEAARFLDCDLAIIAAPPPRYQRYCLEIAEEYAALPAEAFRAGRAGFVRGLLTRPRLFLSELFHQAFDEQARANLRAEASSLGA